jgi:hypothetical protein
MPRLSYLPRDGIDSNHLKIYIIIPLMIWQSQSKSYHPHTSETTVPIEHLPHMWYVRPRIKKYHLFLFSHESSISLLRSFYQKGSLGISVHSRLLFILED